MKATFSIPPTLLMISSILRGIYHEGNIAGCIFFCFPGDGHPQLIVITTFREQVEISSDLSQVSVVLGGSSHKS